MAQTNRVLAPDVDTVFLTTSLEYAYLSSTISEGGGHVCDGDISEFAPEPADRRGSSERRCTSLARQKAG